MPSITTLHPAPAAPAPETIYPVPAGPPGPTGQAIIWKGAYDPFQAYPVGSIVEYNLDLWIALADLPAGVTPVSGPNWDLFLTGTFSGADFLRKDGNLSGLANIGTSRANLGITPSGDAIVTAANAEEQRTALGISAANTPSAATGNIASTNVQAALAELDTEKATPAYVDALALRLLNFIDNSQFWINVRGYVTNTALSAGAYAHDRWKAGASGCTYTFGAGTPYVQITITAGSLVQVVPAHYIAGGDYVLSWTGTAQCRVNGGSYQSSPIALTSLPANTNVTLEWGTGTLSKAILVAGATPAQYLSPRRAVERLFCEQFCRQFRLNASGVTANGIGISVPAIYSPMNATPSATVVSDSSAGSIGARSITILADGGISCFASGTATGGFIFDLIIRCSADL